MLRTLLVNPKALAALLAALVTTAVTFFNIDRSGDAQSAISEVDRRLTEIPAVIKRHTYERKSSNSEKPTDKTRALYELSVPNGEKLTVEGPSVSLTAEVERIIWELRKKDKTHNVDFTSVWDEVTPFFALLTYSNRQIANAKAMLYFDSKPPPVSSYDWDNHFRTSKEPWHVQESTHYYSTRVLYSLGAGTLAFIAVFAALIACGCLWRAVLARIRELFNAFRGK